MLLLVLLLLVMMLLMLLMLILLLLMFDNLLGFLQSIAHDVGRTERMRS